MRIIERRAYARVGLMGNPSDGYHGKTLSFTFDEFFARVVIYPWEHLEIVFSRQDKNRFRSLAELVEDVKLNGYYGGVRLIKAAIKKFAELAGQCGWAVDREPFSIRYESTIPRGVGLAGSSAIVVATLKCLAAYYEAPIPNDLMASLARSVENDELNITCGYQDRAAQVFQGLLYMDFAADKMRKVCGYECGEYTPLDPSLAERLYVAYDLSASKESGAVHGRLAKKVQQDAALLPIMSQIASLAPLAKEALERRDFAALHSLINRNFDLRMELYEIPPRLKAMVDVARSTGASAKFAGSGGAIVGTYESEAAWENLRLALESANPNWRLIRPRIV